MGELNQYDVVSDLIAKNIYQYRRAKGFSQRDLGEACGIEKISSQRTYGYRLEQGSKAPMSSVTLLNLIKICELLGITIIDLFEGYEGSLHALDIPEDPEVAEFTRILSRLNHRGRDKVMQYIEDISCNPRYQSDN